MLNRLLILLCASMFFAFIFNTCTIPTIPTEPIYDNPYDPKSPNFDDELAAGSWVELHRKTSYIYQRNAVLLGTYCYLLGGVDIFSGIPFVSNSVNSFSLNGIDSMIIFWSRTPMINNRKSGTSVSFNDNLYIFGGDSLGTYERLVNETWEITGTLPSNRMTFGAFSVVSDQNILVGGGEDIVGNSSRDIWSFNPGSNSWTFLTQIPMSLSFAAAQIVNNNLYVIGGCDSTKTALSHIYVLNLSDMTWSDYPDTLSVGRSKLVSLVRNKRIYVFGGETSPGSFTNSVDELKLSKNKCVSKAGIPSFILPYGSFLYDGDAYVIGGDEIYAIRVSRFRLPY